MLSDQSNYSEYENLYSKFIRYWIDELEGFHPIFIQDIKCYSDQVINIELSGLIAVYLSLPIQSK